MNKSVKKLVAAAFVASVYAVTTLMLPLLSYGPIQYRLSEGLTVLPYFSYFSIWGLFIGCIASNIISPIGPLDMVFGSMATLIAATLTYYIGRSNIKFKKVLAPLPPVLVNAVVIGALIGYTSNVPIILPMLQVGWGQLVCCYGVGLPLLTLIEKNSRLKQHFL
jgi:uncharacterized membrane protein